MLRYAGAAPNRIAALLFLLSHLLALTASLPSALGGSASPGDIFVTAEISANDWGIMQVDPVTGNRTIVSDNTHGAGASFTAPVGISITSTGALLVTDQGAPAVQPQPEGSFVQFPAVPTRVFLVDPTTGDRTVVSQDSLTATPPDPSYPAIGIGPPIGEPTVARQLGNVYLLPAEDGLLNNVRLMGINPQTGNRTLISGVGRGAGAFMTFPGGIAASGNTAIVADASKGLFAINLTTGDRAILSGAGQGAGAHFIGGWDVASSAGHLVVSGSTLNGDQSAFGIFEIDPLTGNRTVIADGTVGTGPWQQDVYTLAVESGGTILLVANGGTGFDGILTVDPATGNRAFLSDATHGGGASFMRVFDVAVAPLPGDANGDGIVNGQDFAQIASQWNRTGLFLVGDNNSDGIVNGQDMALVASNWLTVSANYAPAVSAPAVAVPEPSTFVLLLVTAQLSCALSMWRLRQSCAK